jgi:hypothetical protein
MRLLSLLYWGLSAKSSRERLNHGLPLKKTAHWYLARF